MLFAGGLLVLLDAVLNRDKMGPLRSILIDLIILVNTPGAERTADEYKALLERKGFGEFQFIPVVDSCQFDVIVARKK